MRYHRCARPVQPTIVEGCIAGHLLRGFRTGFSKVSQLLTKELFYLLPEDEKRKLVVFSDSREDAASISNGIERSHYLDLMREATYDELRRVALGEASLLQDLQNFGEPRQPMQWHSPDKTLEQLIIFGGPSPTPRNRSLKISTPKTGKCGRREKARRAATPGHPRSGRIAYRSNQTSFRGERPAADPRGTGISDPETEETGG